MRAKDVVGQRITGIRQDRTQTNYGKQIWGVCSIETEKGSLLKAMAEVV